MKRYSALVLLPLAFLMVACRAAPEVRGSVEPSDTTPVVYDYDYRNLQFRATSKISDTPLGQMIWAMVTVTNPDQRWVVVTTGRDCALRFTAVSEEHPEVHVREPERGCPQVAVSTVIPPDTTVTPEALRWWTLTRTLLGDSLPEGPYRIVPELILLGPFEWGHPRVHVTIDAGRANLKRAP
jgi:hypothetical protein